MTRRLETGAVYTYVEPYAWMIELKSKWHSGGEGTTERVLCRVRGDCNVARIVRSQCLSASGFQLLMAMILSRAAAGSTAPFRFLYSVREPGAVCTVTNCRRYQTIWPDRIKLFIHRECGSNGNPV